MRNRGTYSRLPIKKVGLALVTLWLGSPATAPAQEPSRPSLARQYTQTTLPTIYNIKTGPFLFRFDASLRIEAEDNVTLGNGTTTPREGDLIIEPELDIDALWTISKLNTLELHTALSYTEYLEHPKLDSSSVLASPDSALKLSIYVGDFKVTLRDQFSYQENPAQQGAVSGVSKFGEFTNDAGFDVLWDLNGAIVTAGYDHTNAISTGGVSTSGSNINTSNLSYSEDEITASVLFDIYSALNAGLEATAASVVYASDATENASRASIGPFLEAQLTHYTKIAASGGYQGVFGNGGGSNEGSGYGTGGNWYADVALSNRLNRYVTNQLSFGRENDIGILSAETLTTFVRVDSNIQIAPQVSINMAVDYGDTRQAGASAALPAYTTPDYQLLTLSLSTAYRITKKMNASFGYDFTMRTSPSSAGAQNQDYTQNEFILTLSYQF